VLEHVADRADGVPLFVEELLRMMIDAGHLVERDDRYELTGPLAGAAIPGTLRALLAARLERLARAGRPPSSRRRWGASSASRCSRPRARSGPPGWPTIPSG
jgi:hypothetical protein